jgi:hypothetical protein
MSDEKYFALLSFSREEFESGFAAICCEYLKKIVMVNDSGARLCTPEECTFLGLTQWNGKPHERYSLVAPEFYTKFKTTLGEIAHAAEDFKSGFLAHKKITDTEKNAHEVVKATKREAKAKKNAIVKGDLVVEKYSGKMYEVISTTNNGEMFVSIFFAQGDRTLTKHRVEYQVNMIDFKKISQAMAKRLRFANRFL